MLCNHCYSYIDSFPGTTEILAREVRKIKNVLSNILSNRKMSYFVQITSTFVVRPSHPHYSQSAGFWMRHLWKQTWFQVLASNNTKSLSSHHSSHTPTISLTPLRTVLSPLKHSVSCIWRGARGNGKVSEVGRGLWVWKTFCFLSYDQTVITQI